MRLPDASDQIRLAPVRALRAVFSGVGQLLLAADRLREEDARQEQEPGNEQNARQSWDGKLSPSVRLISPTGMPVQGTGRSGKATKAKATKAAARSGKKAAPKRAAGGQAGGTGTGRRSGRPKHAAQPSRFRSLDLTGNVRMLSEQDIADLAADHLDRGTAQVHTAQVHTEASGLLAAGTGSPAWSDAAPSWSSWSTSELPISGYDGLSLPSLRARLRNLGPAELRDLLAHERSHANRDDVVTMFERRIAKLEEATD